MDTLSSILEFQSPQDKFIFIFLSALVWYTTFITVIKLVHLPQYDKKTAVNVKQKIVALVYDVIVLNGPLYIYITRGITEDLYDHPIDNFFLLESCGYYMAHLFIVVSNRITHKGQILHHLLTIFTIFAAVFTGQGQFGLLWLFIYQLSHFPLHGRALLKDIGKTYTKIYEIIEIIYFVTYLFERGIGGSWLMYFSIFGINLPIYAPIVGSGLYIQSLYFCHQMCKLWPKKIAKYRERCQKNITYFWIEENPEIEKLSYYRREEKEKIF